MQILKSKNLFAGVLMFFVGLKQVHALVTLQNLQVEYTVQPLGIDVDKPQFSWQMVAPAGERGAGQSAFSIQVKDPQGHTVWDTKKILSGDALGIKYAGVQLKAATRYIWLLTVWDQKGISAVAKSWFETGLMNHNANLTAWDGAKWIGGGKEDMVLYAHYLPIYRLSYALLIAPGSSRASMILAANDSRLMDKNKNLFQVERSLNESYFKVELDISRLGERESGRAMLNMYRAGYTDKDDVRKPVKSFEIKTELINFENRNRIHSFDIKVESGSLTLSIDDTDSFFVVPAVKDNAGSFRGFGFQRGAPINLNPMGAGSNFIPFGLLCDIGFSVDAGQKALFSNLIISNTRAPGNILFQEDLAKTVYTGIFQRYTADLRSGLTVSKEGYQVFGGEEGSIFTADPSHNAMPLLRRKFSASDKKVLTARLYVTARGIYEIYLNGKRVGTDYYNPGLSQYNLTHFYQTYDVTSMITHGQNAIGAMLGEGWWSGLLSFGDVWNHFGDRQSLLAKLVITYSDGTKNIIVTNDKEWKYSNKGPIIYSSLDMGEVYDATREADLKDWNKGNYNDHQWKHAEQVNLQGTSYTGGAVDFMGNRDEFNFDKVSLIGQVGETAGIYKILTAKTMQEVRKGVYVYNMGQNFVGVPRIMIKGGKAGQKITVRVAEVLYPDLAESGKNVGMIMTENYRAALSQDIYIMKDGDQVFQPHFTSHGFAIIEITGVDAPLPLEAVQGLSISSVRKLTANYETSNQKVNQLWSNLTWSNIDNFLTIPTDCPQRNERMGWSGDISIFSRTATYLSNASQFLRRHMIAMRDLQTPQGKFTDIAPVGGGFGGVLWGSAGITVAWEDYQQYKDLSLLEEHYHAMATYIRYLDSTIDKTTGLSSDAQLGDWLGPQNNQLGKDFLVTAYHIFDLDIMSKVAEALHKTEDAAFYKERYNERKAFFNKTFVNEEKKTMGLIGNGGFGPPAPDAPKPKFKVADTQTSYATGLALGAFSDENIPYMAANLERTVARENQDDQGVTHPAYSLMTGFIGTAWVSKSLSDYGYVSAAYKILLNDQYPSWLYAVNQGATTIWERLNGYTTENGFGGNNSMNSFNHYSFGAVGQWMMAYSLGIQRDEAGFKKFVLQPEPDSTGQISWAKGFYDSPYGRINSDWSTEKGLFTFKATVPANTTATLFLPAAAADKVMEGGTPASDSKGVKFLKFERSKAIYLLQPGDYVFSVNQ